MTLIGSTPPGRHIEQHDVFFGIGANIRELIPQINLFWPEAKGRMHFDAWREVTSVNGFAVEVIEDAEYQSATQLFFINLGGYKKGEFEEFHYKMIVAADEKSEAIKSAKQTAFFRHTGFKGANAHIDDKYGVDVDDVYAIRDILPESAKKRYSLKIKALEEIVPHDELHLGYFKFDTVEKWAPL